jgi:hypothetical protein
LTKNNASGFSALPGGYRSNLGAFDYKYLEGCWWSSNTQYDTLHASSRDLGCKTDFFGKEFNFKSCGFSVRLLKD